MDKITLTPPQCGVFALYKHTRMNNNAKMVEFAYPSSPLAVSAGFAQTGCWYIILYPSVEATFSIGKPLQYFTDKGAAKLVADKLPLPYNKNIHRYFNN